MTDTPPTTSLVSRRELFALVRDVRRADRMPAQARQVVMARKRAMVERLQPGWYEDLRDDGVADSDAELQVTEYLEYAATGHGGHPDVEARPTDPTSPEWAAMVDQHKARHDAAVEALADLELDCAADDGSFPDALRAVLEDLARRLGGSDALVETRDGCWEADHIRALAAGADYHTDGGVTW